MYVRVDRRKRPAAPAAFARSEKALGLDACLAGEVAVGRGKSRKNPYQLMGVCIHMSKMARSRLIMDGFSSSVSLERGA